MGLPIKAALKLAGRFSGFIDTPEGESSVKARKLRAAISALVLALLVDWGVDAGIAQALVDLLLAVQESQ